MPGPGMLGPFSYFVYFLICLAFQCGPFTHKSQVYIGEYRNSKSVMSKKKFQYRKVNIIIRGA
jgi:hypothetical protein